MTSEASPYFGLDIELSGDGKSGAMSVLDVDGNQEPSHHPTTFTVTVLEIGTGVAPKISFLVPGDVKLPPGINPGKFTGSFRNRHRCIPIPRGMCAS